MPEKKSRENGNAQTAKIQALKGNTTTFFVGHDTDLHALSLWIDLFWRGTVIFNLSKRKILNIEVLANINLIQHHLVSK